jgi:sigma-B regulation protein RsbU (phosphoserine phosphatase)
VDVDARPARFVAAHDAPVGNTMQKILVVDDAKPNIKILADLLSDQAHVVFATNGPTALEKAAKEDFDLILLDVLMPGMDGYEVCRTLKADVSTADVPVVFVTGLSDEQDEEKGLELGAIDFVTKPFSPAIVRARVRNHLLARQHQKDLTAAHEQLRAAHEKEMRIAHDIQMAMLPKGAGGSDSFGRYEIAALLKPARSVGGDLYDYFSSSPNTICFAVGDVSDKGVPAALFMVKTNTLLRSVAAEVHSLDRILEKVNRELSRDNDACMFVTLIVGTLDVETGEMALANAGHNAPVFRSADGTCAFLEFESGPALGFDPSGEFPVWRSRLEPGEALLLYTDGVTEAFDVADTMFSDERLLDVAERIGSATAAVTTQGLLDAVQEFAGGRGQSDDITVVVLQVGGAAPDASDVWHANAEKTEVG